MRRRSSKRLTTAAAETEFDAIAAAAPDFYFAPYNAALCRLRRGDKEGGLARLQQVHDRFGMLFHGATEALAWAKYNDGDKEGAESLLRQAMDAHPASRSSQCLWSHVAGVGPL